VAVLAATSVDLRRAVVEGRFREDLYHRLAVIALELPPLRLRGPDILTLADHFLARACADYGLSPRTLTPEARAVLATHRWPGNVRELANAMERVALLSDGDEITEMMLDFLVPAEIDGAAVEEAGERSLEDAVRARIEAALRAGGGNIRRTAAALGISRNTLRARMDKYGLRHRDRNLPGGSSSMPETMPTPAPWTVASWDSRRLAFLRVKLLASAPGEGSRTLEMVVDKVRAFGGRIEESGPTGVIAVFGLEPVDNASSHAALAAVAMRNTMAQSRVAAVFAIHCADHLVGRDDGTPLIGMDGKAATWSLLETLVGVDAPGAIVVSGPVAPFLARRFFNRVAHHGRWNGCFVPFVRIRAFELAEELPARAIPRQMVEAQVGRHSLQPSSGRGARFNRRETLERAEEHRLGDVLRLDRIGQEPHRRGKDHVLVFADERLEPIRVGHSGFRPPTCPLG